MNFILLPNFEIVSQLYVGLEFTEAKFWDEEILFLYISLLREFVGLSKFLNYFQWRDFIFGQEHILGNKCLFRLDSSNALLKKASNLSIAFWTLKRKLLGQSEVEKLYLFTSDSLSFYWMGLSSTVLLRGFEHSNKVNETANKGKKDPIYKWIDGDTYPEVYDKYQEEQFKEYRMPENISICFEMISLFILTQFIFSNQSKNNAELPSSLYSKESYVTIAKFFKRNSATLIRILSLFTNEENESKCSSMNVPAPFEMFFDKVFICGNDVEQDEYENKNFDSNTIRLEKYYTYKNHKDQDEKKMKKSNTITLSEFTINAFNYHVVKDSSGEIQLCILLNAGSAIINHNALDDYYLVNNAHGKNSSERISYYLSSKIIHSIDFDQKELVHSLNERKSKIFEIISEKEEVVNSEEARNIIISNSSDLNLYIARPVEYLFIRSCNRCNIYCLDLIANIHIENCQESSIHADCMFATLVSCEKVTIFLHSQFSPLLKSSDDISIGPYNIHCINRKTSYIISYENKLLTQSWRFPISFLSSFNMIKPEKFYMVELLDTNHEISTLIGELPKFPLPSDYYENFTNRLKFLELVRNLEPSSQEEVVNQFVSWICDN
ncbi:conserved beta tubulin folding factor domain [Cryptosporidium sp. chipmunk genotype I]|uniref:conserved beta tubulin folding factor domain n=1 Tax=Cryptosporidium sp. chipmunk genotype I TaxID=1280935 RepID=UPI00351A919A|nr:conserved beta tubulin folding factor domain [Cryptosporidium sp. chipmunk genotype I]